MKNLWANLSNTEPALLYLLVRSIVYIGIGASGAAWMDPDAVEPLLASLAVIMGVDAATAAKTRSSVTSPQTASEMAAGIFVGKTGEFIKTSVAGLVDENQYTRALAAVAPLMADYAQANLNDETRMKLLSEIHRILRGARLIKRQKVGNVTPTSLLTLLAVGLVLGACAPVQEFSGDVINRTTGDEARLSVAEDGLRFTPGEEAAVGVLLEARGVMAVTDERCSAEEDPDEAPLLVVQCVLGDLTEPTVVTLYGEEVTAAAMHRRAGASRVYLTTLD